MKKAPLGKVLAAGVGATRVGRGMTQDGLAMRVRELGFEWTRSTVTAVEGGHRELSIKELFAVCWVLGITPDELLATGRDRLGGVDVEVFSGLAVGADARIFSSGIPRKRHKSFEKFFADLPPAGKTHALPKRLKPDRKRELRYWPGGALDTSDADAMRTWDDAQLERFGSMQYKAAAALQARTGREWLPIDVAVIAHRLWGHSLEEERDRRAAIKPGTDPRTAQARRGHVSRTLLKCLADAEEKFRPEGV